MKNACCVKKLNTSCGICAKLDRKIPRKRKRLNDSLERAMRSTFSDQTALIFAERSTTKLDNVLVTKLSQKLGLFTQSCQFSISKLLLTKKFDRNWLFTPSSTINNTK